MMTKKRKVPDCSFPVLLPHEIEIDIFSRLPAKSLIRFKCVGKSWYRSLIEDPGFISKHLNWVSKNGTAFLLSTNKPQLKYFRHYRPSSENNHKPVCQALDSAQEMTGFVIGSTSVNGLFCLTNKNHLSFKESLKDTNVSLRIHVWNPTSRRIMEIPYPSRENEADCAPFYHHKVGFGFCPKINDYKVLIMLGSDPYFYPTPWKVEAYSLRKSSWKSIGMENPGWKPFTLMKIPDLFFNGASHWLARDVRKPLPSRKSFVMSFNFEEVFQNIMLPNHSNFIIENIMLITEYRYSLALVTYGSAFVYRIWVTKEYGAADSWVQQFSIRLPELNLLSVINFEDDDEVILLNDLYSQKGKKRLFRYHTKSKRLQDLGFYPVRQVIIWKESIVSLPGMIGI